MAYLSDYSTVSTGTAVANKTIATTDMPDHVAGDVIVVAITTAINVASIVASGGVAGSSWVQIDSTRTSGTLLTAAMFYKVAQSAAESCTLTFTAAANHTHIFILKDVDTTTPLAGTPIGTTAATATTITSAAITTTSTDALLLYYEALDSTSTTPCQAHTVPGPCHFVEYSDNGATTATLIAGASCAWYVQRATGVAPQPSWRKSITGVHVEFAVPFKNKVSGTIPAYIDDVNPLGSQLMQGTYFGTTALNGNLFPSTLTLTQLTGTPAVSTTYDAGAIAQDGGLNPYSSGINSSPTISTTTTSGFEVQFTAVDMTTGWIVGTVMGSTAKMALYNQGNIKKGGMFMTIGSGTTAGNNYKSFQILGRDNRDGNGVGFSIFSVQANQTATQYGTAGAAVPNIASISRIGLWQKAMQGSGTTSFIFQELQFIKKITAAGGDSLNPVDSQGLFEVGSSSRMPLVKKVGAAELMAYVPIQIGGGDAVNFQIDSGALQFPRIYSPTNKEVNYHGTSGAIGISYAGKSGDVIYHTNSIITSASPYYWEINAAATSAASWDFTGLVIVNANVTLRPVMTFSSMGFTSCPVLNTTGSTITDCNFLNTKATVTSPANAALITNSTFTKTTGTNYAIEITGTAANITLTNLNFVGYATSNGTTGNEAIFVNIATGSMTISISGGSTPSIRTAGATVNISNPKILTLSGLIAGSDIVIKTSDTNTALVNIDQNAGSTYAYNYQYVAGTYVDILIMKAGYMPYTVYDFLLANTDAELPIAQSIDRNYQ
jgi:hypothetical protein